MKIKKVLELSIDVQDLVNEVPQVIQALLETMPDREGKINLLRLIKQDVDHFLKGADADGEPVREFSRQ